MTPAHLAFLVAYHGARLDVSDDRMRLHNAEALPPELRDEVRERGAEILAFLCGPNRPRISREEAGSPLPGSLAHRDWLAGRPMRFGKEVTP